MLPASSAAGRIAAARAMYDDPGISLRQIAQFLEISAETLARCRKVWDWPLRQPAKRLQKTERLLGTVLAVPAPRSADSMANERELLAWLPEPDPLAPKQATPDPATLATRLEAMVAAQLARLEDELAAKRPRAPQAERLARIIASLVRSLAQIKTLQRSDDAGTPETDTPQALDDLHDELARRLAGLRDDRAA